MPDDMKFCDNCRHCQLNPLWPLDDPKALINADCTATVTPDEPMRALSSRFSGATTAARRCQAMRVLVCGPEAKLFEAKP